MRADLDVSLFYGSLLLSLAAVAVFLWLMRGRNGKGAGPDKPGGSR